LQLPGSLPVGWLTRVIAGVTPSIPIQYFGVTHSLNPPDPNRGNNGVDRDVVLRRHLLASRVTGGTVATAGCADDGGRPRVPGLATSTAETTYCIGKYGCGHIIEAGRWRPPCAESRSAVGDNWLCNPAVTALWAGSRIDLCSAAGHEKSVCGEFRGIMTSSRT